MSNKIYGKFDGEIVCIMIEGVGLCIGKLSKVEEEVPALKKPRAVQIQQIPGQGSQMRLGEMVGSPDELFMLIKPIFIYKVVDKAVKDLYSQATSSLVVANKIPPPEIVK